MNFVRTGSITFTHDFIRTVLADMDTLPVAPALDAVVAVYITSLTNFTGDTTFADLAIADLGSAGVALAWTAPINLGTTKHALKAQAEAIAGPAPTVETLTGVAILDGALGVLIGGYRFEEDVPIQNEGDIISADVILALDVVWPTSVT